MEAVGISAGIAKLLGLTAHGAVAKGTAAATVKGSIAHGAVAKGTAVTVGHGTQVSFSAVLGATVAASTVGGITFVKLYNNLLDDLYKEVKRRGRRMPTRSETQRVLDLAYINIMAQLEAEGILTPADRWEIDKIYWNCRYRQQLALTA